MKRALGLALAAMLVGVPAAAHEDDDLPTIICTMAGNDPFVSERLAYGAPWEPTEEYVEQFGEWEDEAVEVFGGWVPFPPLAENGRPAYHLCDTWLFLPERLFD